MKNWMMKKTPSTKTMAIGTFFFIFNRLNE
jgi:hypothetical protein